MSTATIQSPFPSDALDTNRLGQLSPAQRKGLSGLARADRKGSLSAALFCVVFGGFILIAVDSSKPATVHYGVPVVAFAAALFFLWRATSAGDALARDLHGSQVQSIEGAITKWVVQSASGSTPASHYIEVENHRFEVGRAAYDFAPEAGIVRVFYLPQSKFVVNMEHLADRPLPAGAIEAPMDTLKQAFGAMRSHDHVQAAEARATMAALGNAERAILTPTAAAPPAAGQRDPRPLAEAILGTWQLGPMKVRFSGDGTAAILLPTGGTRDGHWSVDSSGRLHLDALMGGQEETTDAWVTGDSLTVSLGGQGLTAHRIAG
jgi:hypothetical protein